MASPPIPQPDKQPKAPSVPKAPAFVPPPMIPKGQQPPKGGDPNFAAKRQNRMKSKGIYGPHDVYSQMDEPKRGSKI